MIVAMTPQDANRVRYAPTLTTQRIMLQKMWPIGGGWKTFAVYKKPFWRAQGLNGGAITDLPAALYTADNSPPDGSLGVLLSFFGTANQKFEFGGSPRQLNDLRGQTQRGARRVRDDLRQAGTTPDRVPREGLDAGTLDRRVQGPRTPWAAHDVHVGAVRSRWPDSLGRHRDRPDQRGRDGRGVRAGERAAREVVAALGGNPSSIPA